MASRKLKLLKNPSEKAAALMHNQTSALPEDFINDPLLAEQVVDAPDQTYEDVFQEQIPQDSEQIILDDVINNFSSPEEFNNFNRDISHQLPEQVLNRLAIYLEEVTEEDIKTHQIWLDNVEAVKPYLGFDIKNINSKDLINPSAVINKQAKTFDTTFSSSLLRLWATIRAEILPSKGPVGFKTTLNNDEALEMKGSIISDMMNEYLTSEDRSFYPDYDRFLLYLILYGCVFRKVYFDQLTKKPVSRFILPEDFLVDNNCSNIEESNRLTHILHLSKREIILKIQQGVFCDVDLPYLNTSIFEQDKNSSETEQTDKQEETKNTNRFKFYETHEYLDLNEFFQKNNEETEIDSLPAPYVIVRCATTNKIVSLVPNWEKDDPLKTRINCFVHYNLFPGFDIYGLGLAQILGTNAISLTEMQRMAIDAAIFQNFPGGIRVPGLKDQNNDLSIGPGQWAPLDTGTIPLNQAIMPLPYQGPSPALLELSQRIVEQTQQLASTAEITIPDAGGNTPVGTTMAMLEVANRIQSTLLRTIHMSFGEELNLLFELFYSESKNQDINFKIIPVSDPSLESTTMRIVKAENLLKIASSAPELHNMRVIYERIYKALGIDNIEEIFVPQQTEEQQEAPPIDPLVQAQMADTEQRRLEVESKERIAMLEMEADGYKTQMTIELDKLKIENDRYIADLKAKEAEEHNSAKLELDLLKIELEKREHDLKLVQTSNSEKAKSEIELVKVEKDTKINELENIIKELQTQLTILNGEIPNV